MIIPSFITNSLLEKRKDYWEFRDKEIPDIIINLQK